MADIDNYASQIERDIAGRLVTLLLDDGYLVSVDDGEEITLERSADAQEIRKYLCSTGQDTLFLHRRDNQACGWILLIWGNNDDLISDYTVNLEPVIGKMQSNTHSR